MLFVVRLVCLLRVGEGTAGVVGGVELAEEDFDSRQ